MSLIIFTLIATITAVLFLTVLNQVIFKGKWEYGVYFLIFFLPFYITILSVTYLATQSPLVVTLFQFLKELMVFCSVIGFVLYQKNLVDYPFRITGTDKMFLALLFLGLVYMILPIGESSFINRLLYFKNMLIPGLVYFLGRNTKFNDSEAKMLFKGIFIIAIGAFLVNLFEYFLDIHIQTLSGYALFNLEMNEIEPSGNFGLTWTFETQSVTKRFASFFSDPLELASSVMIGFSAGLIWFLTTKKENSWVYTLVMICSFGSLIFSSSRAAFAAFFVMIFFIAIIFKLYKLILSGFFGVLIFVIYVVYIAPEDIYYFVLDTLTFENTSSAGHIVEWLLALDSMISNPLGIGLAMSGNMGSVEDDLRVGGENQFLIYGVQLGWLGMFLYIFLLFYGIKTVLKLFNKTKNVMTARIAFVAAATKVGLLLPLFTANAEVYTYVSWISWWMLGYGVRAYNETLFDKPALA